MDYLSRKNIFNQSIQFPYSGMRRKEILVFVTTWKELEGYLFSEISQTEKYKCVGYLYIYKYIYICMYIYIPGI